MAFVLALNNRGFSEISVNGFKAGDMANEDQQDVIEEHEQSLDNLKAAVAVLDKKTDESVAELEERLDAVESSTRGNL